ncbi:hypothetical protein [Streptomyces sp. NPDC059874]|uniref:hypothetical protein n=1 Tax=Streptomyces sp. NPDC059874 TaxID=3346983 RepID=UPI003645F75E
MRIEHRPELITTRLRSPDPRVREAAARAVTGAVWPPEAERELASALVAAAVEEADQDALAAQLDALPCVEPALDDHELDRLIPLRTDSPGLARLLARAARLHLCGPAEPLGEATRVIVRTLGGTPHIGLGLRTPGGAWVRLERIEFVGREIDWLCQGMTARLTLSGPRARDLADGDTLDADPGSRAHTAGLRSPDPRVRRLAADEASDWPDSWQPEVGRYLCGALAMAAVREQDHDALEAQLHALLALARYLEEPAFAVVRTLDRGALPEVLREYLDDLLEEDRPDAVR